MLLPKDKGHPGEKVASDESLNGDPIVSHPPDVSSWCNAFVVLVLTPRGKYRRRVYLSLHSADKALARAAAQGQPARMVLCWLTPVTVDVLDARWSA